MPRTVKNKFNRGEISPDALDRNDVSRVSESCELMENFLPLRLGAMIYRSGSNFIANYPFSEGILIPFVAATNDKAIIALGEDNQITVYKSDARISYNSSSMTLTDEDFTIGGSWTITTSPGGIAAQTLTSGGFITMSGNNFDSRATVSQNLAGFSSAEDVAFEFEIARGPAIFRVEEVSSGDVLFEEELGVGIHVINVNIPIASKVSFENNRKYQSRVNYCRIVSGGLDIDPSSGLSDLDSVRWVQSADVVFIGGADTPQVKVERRENDSWSVVDYEPEDGPFGPINTSRISLAPNLGFGPTLTIDSNVDFFTTDHVGQLFKLTSSGQRRFLQVVGESMFSESIKITGSGLFRNVDVSITGTFIADLTLQRSEDDITWSDVTDYDVAGSSTENDSLDGEIIYYRLACKIGNYTSGTASATIRSDYGSIDGICRVTEIISATEARVTTYKEFGQTGATFNWYQGEWGANNYPTCPELHEGRLFWAGRRKVWGSVSDEFESFDDTIEGNSAPIRRTIGFGPVDVVHWLKVASRLIMGIASDEISVRSSSDGEVMTNLNVNLKSGSTKGSANVPPVKIDNSLVFVQRSLIKLIQADYSGTNDNQNNTDLMTLHEEICKEGIKRIAVSVQPETRIYVVLNNGEMRIRLQDDLEEVAAWSRYVTDGTIEDIITMPGLDEDEVYIKVNRNGADLIEKLNRIADFEDNHLDSAVIYEPAPSGAKTGLDHLNDMTVGLWGDGQYLGERVVGSGQISTGSSFDRLVVGLRHTAKYQTNRIMDGDSDPVGVRKKVLNYTLTVLRLWPGSITVGRDFSSLQKMPDIEDGQSVDTGTIIDKYTGTHIPFNGDNIVDPRVCLQMTGPGKILSLSYDVVQDNDEEESQ